MNNFTKLGFILATLGSSIGLGHIWRFPYMTGEYGGSAFIIIYILLTIFIGIPILVAKMVIGNKAQKNIVRAFDELDPSAKKLWKKAGIMIIAGPLILTFYAVILGWVFYYLVIVSFNLPDTIESSNNIFNTFTSDSLLASIASFGICIFLTGYIVTKGAKDGLEKYNFILMPLLLFIFIGLLFYAMSMDSFSQAIDFLFSFNIKEINIDVVIMALSQMFFSLSIGVGVIITYSSSAKKGDNLLSSAAWVALSGIVISLIAGMVIFTFLFNFNQPPSVGFGMLFQSIPLVFGQMAYGEIISILFFTAVLFAGITSTISLLEPSVAYLSDTYNMSRKKIAYLLCLVIFVVGLIVIFSLTKDYGSYLTFFGKNFLEWVDFFTAAIIMPFGGLLALIFLGFVVHKKVVYKFVRGFMSRTLFNIWYFIIKYIATLVIVIVFVAKLIETFSKAA